jgi:GTP-binding protein
VTFDWEPSTPAGIDMLLHNRGRDPRLERNDRIGAAERKSARTARRTPTTTVDDATREADERS